MAKWYGSSRKSVRSWRGFMADVRAGRVKLVPKPRPEPRRWGWMRDARNPDGRGRRGVV